MAPKDAVGRVRVRPLADRSCCAERVGKRTAQTPTEGTAGSGLSLMGYRADRSWGDSRQSE
jgi:hypothetical protein